MVNATDSYLDGYRTGMREATDDRALDEITDAQIAALESEAGAAGDMEQVALCRAALDGVRAAREECERTIRAAQTRASAVRRALASFRSQ